MVYTRDAFATATIYIGGAPPTSSTVAGDFFNWDYYVLALGNELTGDRPCLGEIYLAEIFDRVLTPGEIIQNHDAGFFVLPLYAQSNPPTLSMIFGPNAAPDILAEIEIPLQGPAD